MPASISDAGGGGGGGETVPPPATPLDTSLDSGAGTGLGPTASAVGADPTGTVLACA